METILYESVLTEAFMINAVCDRYVPFANVFESIADVYCVPTAKRKELYELCVRPDIVEVDNLPAYNKVQRFFDFCKQTHKSVIVDVEGEKALHCKGKAFRALEELRKAGANFSTEGETLRSLQTISAYNSVTACRLLGVMACCGFLTEKNPEVGCRLLLKSASWNDLDSLLALAFFDEGKRSRYLSMAKTLCEGTVLENAVKTVLDKYGEEVYDVPEVRFIGTYQTRYGLSAEKIDEDAVAVAYAERLTVADRERLFCSGTKESIAAIKNLPLNRNYVPAPYSQLATTGLKREAECKEVEQRLRVQMTEGYKLAKPMLLTVREKCTAVEYLRAVKKWYNGTMIKIDMEDVGQEEYAFCREHFVLSGLKSNNVSSAMFVLFGVEAVPTERLQDFIKLLVKKNREKFFLVDHEISVDLSDSVFVLVTSDSQAVDSKIKEVCSAMPIKDLTQEEKEILVKAEADRVFKYVGVHAVLEESALNYLVGITDGHRFGLLEQATYEKKLAQGTRFALTDADIKSVEPATAVPAMGFGNAKQQ